MYCCSSKNVSRQSLQFQNHKGKCKSSHEYIKIKTLTNIRFRNVRVGAVRLADVVNLQKKKIFQFSAVIKYLLIEVILWPRCASKSYWHWIAILARDPVWLCSDIIDLMAHLGNIVTFFIAYLLSLHLIYKFNTSADFLPVLNVT